jgi:CBS domain-containing protein
MQARDIMSSPVVTVRSETTVKEAACLLASHGFTALPVLDHNDGLVGIITEADVVRDRFPRDPRYHNPNEDDVAGLGDARQAAAVTVGAVMTTNVIGMNANTDVVDLVTTMLTGRVRSMPILQDARVVGVVTRRDLVQTLARDDDDIARDVRNRLAYCGGSYRWTVRVHDGSVAILDEFDNASDRHIAEVLAEAVPGVTAVQVASHPASRPSSHATAGSPAPGRHQQDIPATTN